MAKSPLSDIERFESKVFRIPGGCHVWIAGGNGIYEKGQAKPYGRFDYQGRTMGAHRAAWLLYRGDIPKEAPLVLHKCDQPDCVNPDHLFLGTHQDNALDKATKDRGTSNRGRLPYGVMVDPRCEKMYYSRIRHKGEFVYLGSYRTAEAASIVAAEKKKEIVHRALLGRGEG